MDNSLKGTNIGEEIMTESEMRETAHYMALNNTRWGGDYNEAFAEALEKLMKSSKEKPFKLEWWEGKCGWLGGWDITSEIHTEFFDTIEEAGKRAFELKELDKREIGIAIYKNDSWIDYWMAKDKYAAADQVKVTYKSRKTGEIKTTSAFRYGVENLRHVLDVDNIGDIIEVIG